MSVCVPLPFKLIELRDSSDLETKKQYRGLFRLEQRGVIRFERSHSQRGTVTSAAAAADGSPDVELDAASMNATVHVDDVLHVLKLYGSLTARDIGGVLRQHGFDAHKSDVNKVLHHISAKPLFVQVDQHGMAPVWSAACMERTSFDEIKDLAKRNGAEVVAFTTSEDLSDGARIRATLFWRDNDEP